MASLPSQLYYKIVAPNSDHIVGSNSKNDNGELYTVDLSFRIAQPTQVRDKKILNFALALLFLLFMPIIILWVKNRVNFIKNCFKVLSFRYNWVGYSADYKQLPRLKPAILTPLSVLKNYEYDPHTAAKICFFYAKDYHIYTDLDIILKCFKQLGDGGK